MLNSFEFTNYLLQSMTFRKFHSSSNVFSIDHSSTRVFLAHRLQYFMFSTVPKMMTLQLIEGVNITRSQIWAVKRGYRKVEKIFFTRNSLTESTAGAGMLSWCNTQSPVMPLDLLNMFLKSICSCIFSWDENFCVFHSLLYRFVCIIFEPHDYFKKFQSILFLSILTNFQTICFYLRRQVFGH